MTKFQEKAVTIQQPPVGASKPSPRFEKDSFESAIWNYGYEVIHEKALRCPCKSKGGGFSSKCVNCGGTGWVFINPSQTRAILHSMNADTEFKEWSEEHRGMVNISVRDSELLSYMDRLTVVDGEAYFSEVLFLKQAASSQLFTMTSYNVKEPWYVALYEDDDLKLLQLEENIDYTYENNFIYFDSKFADRYASVNGDLSVTVRYKHAPQFYVIDLKRELMNTNIVRNGREASILMPVSAVGRRGHYILDAENLSGTRLLDNSFKEKCGDTQKQGDELC